MNFRSQALSNNHLLSDDAKVDKTIKEVTLGDQILMRGYLAEYSHSNNSFKRGTSITRDDTGAYACETVFVADFKILKKSNQIWRKIYNWTKYIAIVALFLSFGLWLKTP